MDIRNFFKQVPRSQAIAAPSNGSGVSQSSSSPSTPAVIDDSDSDHEDIKVDTADASRFVELPKAAGKVNLPKVKPTVSTQPAGGPEKRSRAKAIQSSDSEYSSSGSSSSDDDDDDLDSDESGSDVFSDDDDEDDNKKKTKKAPKKAAKPPATARPAKPSASKAAPKATPVKRQPPPSTPPKPIHPPASSVVSPAASAPPATPVKAVKSTPAKAASTPSQSSVSLDPAKSNIPSWIGAQNRGPPPLKGLKKPPLGEPNCLGYGGGGPKTQTAKGKGKENPAPLTFVISGVLDSLERDECEHLVKSFGGRVTGSVSGKTDYLILGQDGGESKKKKALDLGTQVIDEDGLFQLIIQRSPSIDQRNPTAQQSTAAPTAAVAAPAAATPAPAKSKGSLYARKAAAAGSTTAAAPATTTATSTTGISGGVIPANLKNAKKLEQTAATAQTDLWVDKYKPSDIQHIVGNGTAVAEIVQWLKTWNQMLAKGKFDSKDKDAPKRAILLSGGPGLGKTTAAVLCAKKAGLKPIEFNASDTRSKNSIAAEIGVLANNKTLNLFVPAKQSSPSVNSNPLSSTRTDASSNGSVIIMDEVDGVSASDRGGIAELIKIIKTTTTPIICICNDAGSDKIKSLKNYCKSYTWRKPPASTIANRLCELAAAENMEIDKNTMEQLIQSTHSDIRQAINMLQLMHLTRKGTAISYNDMRLVTDHSQKDFDLGPYDVVPTFFRAGYGNAWMNESLNRYFVSDLIPFFIQENYLRSKLNTGYGKIQQQQNMTFGNGMLNNNANNAIPSAKNSLTKLNQESSTASIRSPAFADLESPSPPVLQYSGNAHNMILMSMASDSISESDVINIALMQEQNYSLMPLYGVMSTIYPGFIMSGGLSSMVEFPRMLGKISSGNKMTRAIILFRALLSLSSILTRYDAVCLYLPVFHRKILELIKGNISLDDHFKQRHHMRDNDALNGPECAAELLAHLSIQKDDFDLFNELMDNLILDANKDNRYASLTTSLKTALTRALNKAAVPQRMSKSKRLGSQTQAVRQTLTDDEEFELANNELQLNSDENDDDHDNDDAAFIKASQVKTSAKRATAKKTATPATKKSKKTA